LLGELRVAKLVLEGSTERGASGHDSPSLKRCRTPFCVQLLDSGTA
jgi:hypothetical protein